MAAPVQDAKQKSFHQLWRGDSRDLCARFKPGRVDCIITDPPFGVDNLSHMATTQAGKDNARKIAGDSDPQVAISLFQEVMDILLPRTAEHCDMYIFTAWQVLKEWLNLADSLSRHGFRRSAMLVWDKDGPGMGDLDSWGMGYEIIIYLKKGRLPRMASRRSGVLSVPQLRPSELIHPHEKPLDLLAMLIRHSTKPGDFIVDPFAGSGSTVRAARREGRNAVGIELDEKNYQTALNKLNSSEMALF